MSATNRNFSSKATRTGDPIKNVPGMPNGETAPQPGEMVKANHYGKITTPSEHKKREYEVLIQPDDPKSNI